MAGTYTKLYYHIVFSTKNRQPFIGSALEDEVHKYISGIIRGIGGSCVEINGMADHVHILSILRRRLPSPMPCETSRQTPRKWIHETKPELLKFGWQDGFAAFTVSKSQVEPVRMYIRAQKQHHSQRDYKTELLGLLARHDVEYDERYIWD